MNSLIQLCNLCSVKFPEGLLCIAVNPCLKRELPVSSCVMLGYTYLDYLVINALLN